MDVIYEFIQSLGVIGYIVIGIVLLCLFNLRKLLTLKSPLDSWQHRAFQRTGGVMNPEHLDREYIVKEVKAKEYKKNNAEEKKN